MKKLLAVAAVLIIVACMSTQDAFARRGGGQRGGRGGQSVNPFAYGYQAQAMQQRQIQGQMRHRYRQGDFSCRNGMMQQPGSGDGVYSRQPQMDGWYGSGAI